MPRGDDTEFTVAAETVSTGVFLGLSVTGTDGAASVRHITAALVLILAVMTGLAWRRWGITTGIFSRDSRYFDRCAGLMIRTV